jgi:hypothetical protein
MTRGRRLAVFVTKIEVNREFRVFNTVYKKASRWLVMTACFWLPEAKEIHLERWLRGRHESAQLRRSDVVVVSFGKSGRTWLRVLLGRLRALSNEGETAPRSSLKRVFRPDSGRPRIFFTHDNYIKDYSGHFDSKADFYGRRVVLLVRDPRDVTVSQFFQWQHRMNSMKTRLNHFPPLGTEVSVYDFVMNPLYGLVRCTDFMNLWAREANQIDDLLIVRYEDMRRETVKVLSRIAEFIGESANPESIEDAVEYASVANMRMIEATHRFTFAGSRLKPGDKSNPDSYKVRRAKVGGYRDYFEDEEVETIDRYVAEHLAPEYGY